jgi:hypothetical protein
MGRLSLAPVVKDGFSLLIDSESEADAALVRFAGTADMEATLALEHFLKRLHSEALRWRLRQVAFDVSQLDFMNSSCFKCFVSWVDTVAKAPSEVRYEVRFVASPHLQWQRRSLEALHRFAPDVVVLEPLPGQP